MSTRRFAAAIGARTAQHNAHDLVAAVEFIERHHAAFPFAELVRDRFRLDEVNAAFAYALNSSAYRVGIRLS